MAQAVADDFRSSLLDLNCNSKPHISMLTMLAEENLKHASIIVETIVDYIAKVNPGLKLPCLYLVDSIMKTIGEQYINLFNPYMISLFSTVFEKVDENTRSLLFKLRQTWTGILEEKLLYSLDLKIKELDPAWPITSNCSKDIPINATSINIETQEEISRCNKIIELKADKKMICKKRMLNQLVEKHKQLQLSRKNPITCNTSKQIEEVSRDRMAIPDLYASSKDMKLKKEENKGGTEGKMSVSTNKFLTQNLKPSQKVPKMKRNTTDFVTDVRTKAIIAKSGKSLKLSNKKHPKLGFCEWEQTRNMTVKSNDNSHNVCTINKDEMEHLNKCSDSKQNSCLSSKDIVLKQNCIVNEEKNGSFHNHKTFGTDSEPFDATDLNKFKSISNKTDIHLNVMQPENLQILSSSESIIEELDNNISQSETYKDINEPNILPKDVVTYKENKKLDAIDSNNILENVKEIVPLKRSFQKLEISLSENEMPEKIIILDSSESDQFSAGNNEILFGKLDQDLRRLTEQEFEGRDEYKKAYPEEYLCPQKVHSSLEGKESYKKFPTKSSSSHEDTPSCQHLKDMHPITLNKHKRIHLRESHEHFSNASLYFNPYFYIQKAEESFKNGKIPQSEYLELCKDLKKMLHNSFWNPDEKKESQIKETKTAFSSFSLENSLLKSQKTDSPVLQGAKEFILDGHMRMINFIEKQAFIILDNDEPHELSFKGEEICIHIEDLVCCKLLEYTYFNINVSLRPIYVVIKILFKNIVSELL